jgi:hypothetical protein
MRGIGATILVALVLGLAAAVAAQPQPKPEPGSEVILGGKLLWIFRATAGGKSPAQRADACIRRSVDILSDPAVSEKDIKIVVPKKGAEPQIQVGKYLFVTVTMADAKANKIDPMTLAKTWSKNLSAALNIARVHRPEEKH